MLPQIELENRSAQVEQEVESVPNNGAVIPLQEVTSAKLHGGRRAPRGRLG